MTLPRTPALLAAALAATLGLAAPGMAQAPAAPDQDHTAHHPDGQVPSPSQAQPQAAVPGGPGMMMGSGMGRMMEMMMSPAHVEGRIAFLRTELGITDAQQPQWTAFADAMRRNASSMMDAMGKMMGGGSPTSASAPDRLERRIAAMSAHVDAARAMLPPLQALYAVLTEAQRKTADELLVPPMGRM